MEPIRDAEALGRLVRDKRRQLGLNQTELAGIAGVGTRFVSELERGKPTAELGKVLQLLERLGLDVWVAQRGQRTPDE
jgi:y4mF family transcriptional regulator